MRVGSFGNVCVHNSGTTDFIVDVTGYLPDGSFDAFDVPQRLLDTREASATVDGMFEHIGERDADSTLELEVAGRGDVPDEPDPVVLTVTADGASDAGYVTVHPCDGERPTASNLNHAGGQTIANTVVSRVGADGNVCLYTDGATHLIGDVAGTLPASTFGSLDRPQRVLDTREGGSTADDEFAGDGQRPDEGTIDVDLAGRVGVPDDATGAVLNVTAVESEAAGFVTVHPSGTDRPNASNLNYVSDTAVANVVFTGLGDDGAVQVHNSAATDLVIDVVGWFPASDDDS